MRSARIAIVSCSDSRTTETDESGLRARDLLVAAGHVVILHEILPDDADRIAEAVQRGCSRGDLDAIILTGGTGLAPRDVTIEAVRPLLDKELPGFGEAFRRLSWDQVGARSLLSRALAGSRGAVFIAALPGSPRAVELAVEALLGPILGHAVDLLHGRTSHGRPPPPPGPEKG